MEQTIGQQFNVLKDQWIKDTQYRSSGHEKHPAYQEIIKLGKAVLPYIFSSLEKECLFWFPALAAITGEDPITEDQWGHMKSMQATWINWAKEHGYISTMG